MLAGLNRIIRKARKPERRRARRPAPPPDVVFASIDGDRLPGKVDGLSPDGIGLLLDRGLECGADVTIGLTSRTGLFACSRTLRTARSEKQDDGTYLVSGGFADRLSPEELRALLC